MAGGWEPAHVRAGLGNDHVGDPGADPGDGADQLPESLKRLDHHLDPCGQLGDRLGVLVDQVQVRAGQERVVLGEPSGQRLGQGRDLGPQYALGEVGALAGVSLTGDEPLEHGPAGPAGEVRGHGVEQFETKALGWTDRRVYVRLPDSRWRFTSVWLDAADVRRR